MIAAGWSPSVRLFEAAACGTAIVSDIWQGIDEVLTPGREIILATEPDDVIAALSADPAGIGEAGRNRVLAAHTAAHRALQLEAHLDEAIARRCAVAVPDLKTGTSE